MNWVSRFCDIISFKKFTDFFRSTNFDRINDFMLMNFTDFNFIIAMHICTLIK